MATVLLNSEIKLGAFKPFKGVNEVTIKKSLLSYMDTAVIKLPATARMKQSGTAQTESILTAQQFKRGDAVSIKLGYDGVLTEEFKGFISRVNKRTPCEIECEGYAYQLREKTINKSWKNTTLKSVLQEIVGGTDIKLSNDIPDVQIEKLNLAVISGRSTQGVPVLDELKKVLGEAMFLRFDNDVLYADLGYTNISNKLAPAKADVYYKIGYNVPNADDMKEHIAGDVTVKIYTSYRQKNGQYMQEEAGQPGGGVIRKRLQHISDAGARKKIADAEESKRNYTGFEGSITAFLIPFCKPGMKVKIENQRYPEMDSSLIADSVEVRYGTRGARRIVALSHALN